MMTDPRYNDFNLVNILIQQDIDYIYIQTHQDNDNVPIFLGRNNKRDVIPH